MGGGEAILLLLGIFGVLYVLLGPILLMVLWGRVNRTSQEVGDLRIRLAKAIRDLRTSDAARVQARDEAKAAPVPELEKSAPSAESPLEIVETYPRAQVEPAGDGARPAEQVPVDAVASLAASRRSRPEPIEQAETTAESSSISLEEILAGRWLTWVGALAVIIGIGFFFKYAIDNDWIGPTGRVMLGLVLGMGTFAGGAFAMLKDYKALAQGLVGAALGILYFSLFAAFQWYHLFGDNSTIPFLGMVLVTAAGLTFAGYFDALATAILALIGGFLTPMMLSTGVDAQVSLFTYILILDAGVLGLATFRKWQSLQILAFAGSLLIWIGWAEQFYTPEILGTTLVLMTLYFLLFALLAVWHNVIRKVATQPGDFFLILATPVVYFIGLYGITLESYSDYHGLMALGMAAVYLVLAAAALTKNPEGKKIVVALGGIAASFVTVAVPLQLTGHWIAIAWAAESLLLVELGLRFHERKLRLAGFGLLIVVQLVLVYYGLATVGDPNRFETRFTRVDRVAVDLDAPGLTPRDVANAIDPRGQPSWTDIFNGRSFSFLASIVVLSVLAWEYHRRGMLPGTRRVTSGPGDQPIETSAEDELSPEVAGTFLAAIPILTLGLLLVESFALGHSFHWLAPTYLGVFAFWSAVVGVIVVAASVTTGPGWLSRMGAVVFGVGVLFLAISAVRTLDNWRYEYPRAVSQALISPDSIWRWMIFNPRGLGFLAMIVAAAAAALLVRESDLDSKEEVPRLRRTGWPLTVVFGTLAHLTGLIMLTIEVYAQGVVRQWTDTALYITFVWTAYAIATLVAGITTRSKMLRVLSLALFLLTTAKVFFYDVWILNKAIRTLAFVGLGVSLLLVSFLYRRYRDRIRAWMAPTAVVLALLGGPSVDSAFAQARSAQDDSRVLRSLPERWVIPPDAAADRGHSTLRKISLPAELYAVARIDLGDLRIFSTTTDAQAIREIPYVLVAPADTLRVVERPAPLLNLAQNEKLDATEFVLDLSTAEQPANEVTIHISDSERNYMRPVKVYGGRSIDTDEWSLLTARGFLMDTSRTTGRLTIDRIEFPPSRFAFYKVSIENLGQPPLEIRGAKLAERVQQRASRQRRDAIVMSTTEDDKTHETHVMLDLGVSKIPSVAIDVGIAFEGNFNRPAKLEVINDLKEPVRWQPAAAGFLYRVDRPGLQASRTRLEFGEVRGRYLRLTIANGDDEPLQIRSVKVEAYDKLLIVENGSFHETGRTAAVYAGHAKLPAPQYDLARTIPATAAETAHPLALGPQELNPFYAGALIPEQPWSERNKSLLWTFTILGIIVLGGLTVMLLKMASRPTARAE